MSATGLKQMNEVPEPQQVPADRQLQGGLTQIGDSADTSTSKSGDPRAATQNEADYWIGRKLARYEINRILGIGGMGVVYCAYDTLIEREVAIKVLPRVLSADETVLKRFLIEAKAAGRLNHAHAVGIYEIGQEGDTHFLVMEFVPGGCVGDRLERNGPYSVIEATRIVAEAGKGLAAAHLAGLVHRDIKPANLLFAVDGTIKVADFGLAKTGLTSTERVTLSGQVLGTPYFMSPEQCQGEAVDHRSDLYSLGATYYSLLTGAEPYGNVGSIVQIMFAHCQGEIPDPRTINKFIPDACAGIIARSMAKRPEDRYQSADEMVADLTTVLNSLLGTAIKLPSSTNLPAAVVQAPVQETSSKTARSSRRQFLVAGGGLTAMVLCGLGIGLPRSSARRESADARTASGSNGSALPKGAPLRVGILHSLSGTLASSEAPVVDAVVLAIAEINAAGGLLGRPVEAIVADGHSEAAVFAAEAQRLIVQENVRTVFGCWTSASRKTVVPIFEEQDNLLVYPVQYEGIEESPNVIYMGAAPNQQIIPAVHWAFETAGKRRFFLVGSDYVFPRTANAIIKDTLHSLGAELAGEEYLPLGETEARDVARKIVASKPDVILNTINGDSNRSFFRELRRAGITPDKVPTISFSIGEVELRNFDLTQMAGDYAAWNYFQSLTTPENLAFVRKFQARFGNRRVVTDPMEAAYVGVKLWADAVRQARSDRPADIRRAMQNRRLAAPEGEVRIDPATQHAFKTPRIGKITPSGQFEIVWTASKPEAPKPYPSTRTAEQWKVFLNDLRTGWGNQWAAPAE